MRLPDGHLARIPPGAASTPYFYDSVGFSFEILSGARHLVDTALLGGSQDNCTAIVIPLGAWGKYKSPAKKVRHLFIGSSGRY